MKARIEGMVVRQVDKVYTGKTLLECTASAKKDNPGLQIESIDDREVWGWCEVCGAPLFENSQFYGDCDGVMWCKTHGWE